MRLFIALPIADAVKATLADLQQPIDGLRWQSPDQIHLTLKFLGSSDKSRTQQLTDHLADVEHPPLSLTINGLGTFPKSDRPRVLWAGIQKNDSLIALHQKIEQLCTSLGFESETRAYRPHITLARMKNISRETITHFINKHKQFRISDILIDQFVLYESRFASDGATHHPLQSVKLSSADSE